MGYSKTPNLSLNLILNELVYEASVDKETIAKYIKDNNITQKASKLPSVKSLQKANDTYYRIAWKNGWLDDLFPKESEESLIKRMEDAAKDVNYNRSEFQKKYLGLYNRARKMGLMDKLFGKRGKSKEEFVKLATQTWHDDKGDALYDYTDTDYQGLDKPITVRCPKEGHGDFKVSRASNHLKQVDRIPQGCPVCLCDKRKNAFVEKSKSVHGDLYGYDKVDYCNKEYQIKDKSSGEPRWYFPIYCKRHKDYFMQRADQHASGIGCPVCAESKGELIVKEHLKKLGAKTSMGTFEDCTNKKEGKGCRRLRFDAYIPDMNVVVEYDGKQHFQPVNFFQTTGERFEDLVRRDKLKNDYCKQEGKPRLIRISYKTPLSKIPSVLDELLKKLETTNDRIILSSDYPKEGWNA